MRFAFRVCAMASNYNIYYYRLLASIFILIDMFALAVATIS